MLKQLTILVPARNEEARLETTVLEVLAEARRRLDAFEVIIVNDGSDDGTAAVADVLALRNPEVYAIHRPVNRGVGAAYCEGLRRAAFPNFTLVPGDNAFHRSGVRALFASVGTAELIVSFRANMHARTPLRRFLSACCTASMRFLTGRPIRDAHSLYVFPVEKARRIPVRDGYTYHIEALATLLQTCGSWAEVPVRLNPKPDASSGVMRPRVIAGLVWAMARMYARRCMAAVGLARREAPPLRACLREAP